MKLRGTLKHLGHKKNGGAEPVWDTTHTYMEMSQ
jgi:hypothetical protein